MESPDETKPNVCLMCLDAPAVKKLGTCEHSYCESCLLTHITVQVKGQDEVIPCPACRKYQLENPKGGTNVDNAGAGEETLPRKSRTPTARGKKTTPVHANCKLCHYKGKTVKAVNVCKECKSVPLCLNCSQAHRKNKVTQNHVVTVLLGEAGDEVLCEDHDEPLELFCTSCSLNVCHICISLDHVDHTVETFNDVVNTEVENVRSALENEIEWLNMLKSDEKELQESKETAQEMEDVLIKSVEDHAEKCIEEILNSKEALKKQLKTDFEVVRVMKKRLEAMRELQRASADITTAANQLLNEQAQLHSTYVEKLVALKQQLDMLKEGRPAYEADKASYQRAFQNVCLRAIKFDPQTPDCEIGIFWDDVPTPIDHTEVEPLEAQLAGIAIQDTSAGIPQTYEIRDFDDELLPDKLVEEQVHYGLDDFCAEPLLEPPGMTLQDADAMPQVYEKRDFNFDDNPIPEISDQADVHVCPIPSISRHQSRQNKVIDPSLALPVKTRRHYTSEGFYPPTPGISNKRSGRGGRRK